jgi:hypothetical protein
MKKEILLFFFLLSIFCSDYIELSADSKNLNWSSNQGFTSWNKARYKCAGINMRLPTIEELKSAYKSGVTESWKKNGNGYWSSTVSGDSTSYSFDISHGTTHSDERRFSLFVRCVK